MNEKRHCIKIITVIKTAFYAFLWLIPVFFFVSIFLFSRGWERPVQSLQAKAEMRSYLEETYAGQELRIEFPVYNTDGNEFLARVKDEEGQILFGLSYASHGGIAEHKTVQGNDGQYYISGEKQKTD